MRVDSIPGYVPLVAATRGGRIESVHSGALVVATADGATVAVVGDAGAAPFLRSSAKPFQVLPLLASGAADRFGFTDREIAVAVASHHAEPQHLEAVGSMLRKIGLDESALACGTHEPVSRETALALRAAGREPTQLHCNCSGKHTGMLAVAVHHGQPTVGYHLREHAVQQEMFDVMSEFAGIPAGGIPWGVDGCSLPTFSVPLAACAAALARLSEPRGIRAERAEAAARAIACVRRHPFLIGGTGSLDCELVRDASVPLIAKLGAEGYFAMSWLQDGRGYGAALKIADGSMARARDAAVLAIVRRFDLVPRDRLAALEAAHLPPVRNNRRMDVGTIEILFTLQ